MKRSALAEPSSPLAVSAQPKAKKLKVSRSPHSSASVSASVAVTVSVPTATPKSSTADTEDGDGWTKVEKRRAKKMRKADAKMSGNPPRFFYVNGEILRRKEAVAIGDVRDLILHLLGDASPQPWLKVENPRSIAKVVTLFIPGLKPDLLNLPPLPTSATVNPNLPLAIPLPPQNAKDAADIEEAPASQLPFIASTFSHACPTRAPGDQTKMHSVLSAFFHGPVSGEEKKRRTTQRVASERGSDNAGDPTRYMLSPEQMVENEYPVPSYLADVFEKPEGWVETPRAGVEGIDLKANDLKGKGKARAKVYAIDCEMCLTEDGKELTRVCMIDCESDAVVYDQLVKPPKPITDYLTRWSGITAEALQDVTTTLPTVQRDILAILAPATPSQPTPILLGHSLESDLRALKMCHPSCIDTAVLYHHPRGRPLKPGLAWLTRKWCGREIQARGEGGHDPEEDARACVELLKKKIQNGPGFGEFKTDYESIFERLSRASGNAGRGVRTAVVDRGNPSTWHGAKASATVACKTDVEVLDGLLETVPIHDFVFGRFMEVAESMEWTTPRALSGTADTDLVLPTPALPPLDVALASLNKRLTQLHALLPPRTALVIFSGHSDPRRMSTLNARKTVFENAIRAGKKAEEMERETWWTSGDGRELEEEVERAKRGLLFLCLKE